MNETTKKIYEIFSKLDNLCYCEYRNFAVALSILLYGDESFFERPDVDERIQELLKLFDDCFSLFDVGKDALTKNISNQLNEKINL